jgi:Tfp pilus assembly protein PilN
MRPVNLLPPELRQGARAPMRTGPIPYLLVGALVAVLVGVALLVITSNQISEKKDEVAQLKREDAAAVQEAKRLAGYTQFQALHEERVATITSLADSRFDWERVMRELALVLPHSVWLTELNASASSENETGGGGGELRSAIAGPALELQGCATSQEAVADFVTALKDIDGVTRVGVQSSELGNESEGAGSTSEGSSSAESGGECQTRKWIAKFEIVVAFDAAPIPIAAGGEGEASATATEAAESTSSEAESSESESAEGE